MDQQNNNDDKLIRPKSFSFSAVLQSVSPLCITVHRLPARRRYYDSVPWSERSNIEVAHSI